MLLLQGVGGYEQQLASLFNSANDRDVSVIGRGSNYLVSGPSRFARKPPADAAHGNYSFDIGKQ
jgi:hypothetical protein